MERPSLGVAGALALSMVAATGWIAGSEHLPVRDHDAILAPSYIQLPAIAVLSVLADVFPRVVRRGWRRPGRLPALTREVLRERWPASYLRFGVTALVICYLVSSSFRNLKAWVPFVNPRQWDGVLADLDRALWFGHEPADVLHGLLGTGWAAHLLSFVYVSWLVLVPFTLGVALLWSRRMGRASWYVTALTWNWFLGLVTYYLVPSLGPVYADPEHFADLPDTWVSGLQASMLAERVDLVADPWSTPAVEPIAAFASLHVALVVTMVLFARLLRMPRWVVLTGWVYLALTTLSTVYLGWHYSVDALGGAAIGATSVWLAARSTGQPPRSSRAEDRTEDQAEDHAGPREVGQPSPRFSSPA